MSGDNSENTLQKILNEVTASKNGLKTYIVTSEAKLLLKESLTKKNIIIFGLEKPFEVTPAFICEEIRRLLQVELKESDISDLYQLGKKNNCPIKVEFISYLKKKENIQKGIYIRDETELLSKQKEYTLAQLESSEGTTLRDTPHLAKKEINAWNEDSSSEEEISDSKCDLNIDPLNQQHITCEYKNHMHTFGFKSIINDITRPSSKTCLDHFYVEGWNTLNDDLDGYISHCMITYYYPIMPTANNPYDTQSRKYLGQEMQKKRTENGDKIVNPQRIVDIFNEYYSNLGQNYTEKISIPENFKDVNDSQNDSIFLKPTATEEAEKDS
ncbi:hypothetical protein WA026_021349 [Henosepilachna vigintioctopunctata]|uniref:Uncharacterized protein n=1 Tax=Henosepilachna vigintioctopunctata TaxID=420089 RepID=A0AAW1UCJ5_9CUCU